MPRTVTDALAGATARLKAADIPYPRAEARLLLAHAMQTDGAMLIGYPERPLSQDQAQRFDALVSRRAAREPAARLLGHQEFWSLSFAVGPETLIPRPDSETIVEAALDGVTDRAQALKVLDLGCGTGCLLLAILSELPNATGLGVDLAPGAVSVAQRNAESLGLAGRARFQVGRWADGLQGPFDLIVSNPPYIEDADIDGLQPEVARHEPRLALAGGADGLDCYRAICAQLGPLVRPGSRVVFEIGQGQEKAVGDLLLSAGSTEISQRFDLSGIVRAVIGAF